MKKEKIYTTLGTISFVIGIAILSFISWLFIQANSLEIPLKTVNSAGAVLIVGIALIIIGTIVIVSYKDK